MSPEDIVKTCYACGETKPLDDFSRNRARADGRQDECKECRNRRKREYRQRVGLSEREREYRREYARKHGPEIRLRKRIDKKLTQLSDPEWLERFRRKREALADKRQRKILRDAIDEREAGLDAEDILRECGACHRVKPLSEFYRRASGKHGHGYWCKTCKRQKGREWYAENRERVSEYNRQYRENNYEKVLEGKRRWYAENRERVRAHEREREKDPKRRAYHREKKHRRRARKAGAPISRFTPKQWRWLKELYGNRCAYCGKVCNDLERDHIIPIAQGGNHSLGNIVPACPHCNRTKHARTPEEAGMTFAVRVNVLEHMEQAEFF